ncbi:MAG: mannose-1-phosphate guanylyltransferase/mannose-6-phosphate isomerase [Proteobacteria bacterium]|nr:mannose-1-phosphate guanylyltransferase/mannose-6-phosphate isomerase [Pseudomonadota bacterium]MBU1388793.1 mannose-1-phosphate guanylyltransferase/mannose-6-phosphate isomerase [Pseudomonadota bacterium]MBU1543134.1 mannose-1-phosphate guanylyltransferase/mannose-6-phosphate isomerase [Pseudomonadota bacterium]MBU2431658.1 mannose-1-phosphate guanylyltransferase/mannose-6-phosphate isomerase [Pseudomonadota bacterium]MBU2481724.1 mannose-1-phosphate guanylyltransferase/mannose-6-phosphate 
MMIPVILAGGSGTRLWPLSRELYPKQLIGISNTQTMLQNTVLRLEGVPGISAPIIVCNEEHRFMTAEQLRQIQVAPRAILLEPIGRNTAPAIALAALSACRNGDDDPVLLVLPADHVIENISEFHAAIAMGELFAQKGNLITFGVIPDSPETGYGYIKKGEVLDADTGAAKIEKFVEKPDRATAEKYLDSGAYCWNSGMFMFKTSVILEELETHSPRMLASARNVMNQVKQDLDFSRLPLEAFKQIPSDSIDYAVMEKTSRGVVIPFSAGWNDLGSFDALWQTGVKDSSGNVIKGDVITHDVKESYISSESSLVTAVGLEKFVIVETKDAILVSPRDRVQDVKKIVKQLKDNNRGEAITHRKVYRPWGAYETVDIESRFQVKRISVKPGAKLSLQKHYHRAEHWVVVSGSALITRGEEQILLKEDESTYIPLGTLHRLENPGKISLELIEVQTGSYLGEDDIVRLDDVYGRKKD